MQRTRPFPTSRRSPSPPSDYSSGGSALGSGHWRNVGSNDGPGSQNETARAVKGSGPR
ncbi:hypothetical protein P3T23_003108 [Paraburkholderia sp. GAS448]